MTTRGPHTVNLRRINSTNQVTYISILRGRRGYFHPMHNTRIIYVHACCIRIRTFPVLSAHHNLNLFRINNLSNCSPPPMNYFLSYRPLWGIEYQVQKIWFFLVNVSICFRKHNAKMFRQHWVQRI